MPDFINYRVYFPPWDWMFSGEAGVRVRGERGMFKWVNSGREGKKGKRERKNKKKKGQRR